MKHRFPSPSSEQIQLEEQVEKARQVVSKALEELLARKKTLSEQMKGSLDSSSRQLRISKMADLDDAIRMRKRELNQLYPDRIRKIAKAQAVTPRSSQDGQAAAKVTWAKPYRG